MNTAVGLDLVRSFVRAAAGGTGDRSPDDRAVRPVVTVSRQAGIDVSPLCDGLVSCLAKIGPGDPPWMAYGRQLVERVAEDHNLSEDLVASLDERDKSWFEHFTAGLSGSSTGVDVAMKTARTIRALAHMGHAIVVGRGGQFILQSVPSAVHVRLVAPLEWRVEAHGRAAGLDEREAERAVRDLDRERAAYVKSHFGRDVEDDTAYHFILNVSRVSTARMITIIGGGVEDVLAG